MFVCCIKNEENFVSAVDLVNLAINYSRMYIVSWDRHPINTDDMSLSDDMWLNNSLRARSNNSKISIDSTGSNLANL